MTVIKQVLPFVVEHIHRLLVLSITKGVFPDILKDVILTPVYKNGKKVNEASSYRPVALAISFGRIMDSYVNMEICKNMHRLGILQDSIHGYRKGHSTGSMIHDVVTNTQRLKKNKKISSMWLGLDFSAAYDTVDTNLCKDVLEAIGAGARTAKWVGSFLTGRSLKVKVNESISSSWIPAFGILQGSSLSPSVFSLISSDLVEVLAPHVQRISMYADDSLATLTYTSKEEGLDKIKVVSETIEDWAKAVGLSVNKQKSEFMCLSTGKKNVINEATILGETITSKDSLKLVGITMDRKLWLGA